MGETGAEFERARAARQAATDRALAAKKLSTYWLLTLTVVPFGPGYLWGQATGLVAGVACVAVYLQSDLPGLMLLAVLFSALGTLAVVRARQRLNRSS